MDLENLRGFPPGAREIDIVDQPGIRQAALADIAPLVEKSIADGYYPGAVILVSHRSQIIYRGVFGNKRLFPDAVPMQFNTIFDLASLTKVVVTTTAVMQLVEAGKLDLDAAVAEYWPAFAKNGKHSVTIRELLTHISGLPAILPPWNVPPDFSQRYHLGLAQVEQQVLIHPPGKNFLYGDINFIALGYLVELISGQSLDQYAQARIFKPLNMNSAVFLPPTTWQDQIAPTCSPEDGKPRWGQVNDPTTERMGGVTGVAGLFAHAQDLNTFLQCILRGGCIRSNHYLLSPLTVLKMTSPQTPAEMLEIRGLGWDIDSSFSNRGVLLPLGSFGHTGWTGVSVWVDPCTETGIIILTSRTHPAPAAHNQLIRDRRAIANMVAASLVHIRSTCSIRSTGVGELHRAYSKAV